MNVDIRTEALNRDGYQCMKCGSRSYVVVHHTAYPKVDKLDNLICLCRSCHKLAHSENPDLQAEITTIRISNRNAKRLEKLGRFRETFDDVISRLLDQAKV